MSNIIIRDLKLSEETRQLIDDAVDSGMVTKIQPAAAASNEMSRGTRELIARQRRAFRKAERLANQ
jgi:hypothetical protein